MTTRECSLDQVYYQTWKRTQQLLQQISLSVIFQESIRSQLLERKIVNETRRLRTKSGDLASLSLTHLPTLNSLSLQECHLDLVTLLISVTPITHLTFLL